MALATKKVKIQFKSPETFFTQYRKNIVHSGLFVPSLNPLPLNTPVELTLTIPGIPDPFVIECEVVLTVDEKTAISTGQKGGMAFSFTGGQEEKLKKLEYDLKQSETYSDMFPPLEKTDARTTPDVSERPTGQLEPQPLDSEEEYQVSIISETIELGLIGAKNERAGERGDDKSGPDRGREAVEGTPPERATVRELKGKRIEVLRKIIRDRDSVAKLEKEQEGQKTAPIDPSEDRVKRVFSTEERVRIEPVAGFILNLVKAMLRSGYYAPDHPGSQDAKKGIYTEFKEAISDRPDITLLNQEDRENSDVLISGILEEQVSLGGLIGSEQSAVFIPRFKEYFQRKSLVSFSLKRDLTLENFEDFVDIMSDPKVDRGGHGEVGTLLTDALVEKGITEVSTVFMDDMIILELKLPWRVEMAIQRLAKDLKVLPLFKDKGEEEIQEMKVNIVQDIIRPLREPYMLKDIVVNCHIIARHVDVIDAEDLEQIIVKSFPLEILMPTSGYVFEELTRIKEELGKKPGHEALTNRFEGVKRILKWVSERVVVEGVGGSEKFFEQLYFHEILSFDELPEEVKDNVNTLRLVKDFNKNSPYYMEKLNEAKTDNDLLLLLRFFRRILPDLLENGEYKLLSLITRSVQGKFELHPEFKTGNPGPLTNPTTFIWEDSVDLLEMRFEGAEREARAQVLDIVEMLGPSGVEILINVLMQSQHRFVRKTAVGALVKMGAPALVAVRNILRERSNPWYLHRNALAIISRLGGGKEVELVSQFLRHSNPRIREEALSSLSSMEGPAVEPRLIRALRDPDIMVRRTAVECIGRFPIKSRRVVNALVEIIHMEGTMSPEVKNAITGLKAEAINTLALIGNVAISDDKMVEDLLIDILIPDKKWLQKLSKKVKSATGKEDIDYTIETAALKALWMIGTKRVMPQLKGLAQKGDRALASKAREAFTQIRMREEGENKQT